MCDTCGCGENQNKTVYRKPGQTDHHHEHSHDHPHDHSHPHDHTHTGGHDHEHDSAHSHEHNHSHSHDNDHDHDHSHEHPHIHDPIQKTTIEIGQDILQKNNRLAERNRGYFEARDIFSINFVSSPGSGKTSLLERTILDMKKELSIFVIEGDQQTMNDAERIHKTGIPVIQINTGSGCHLDAEMIHHAVKELTIGNGSLLMIENVGNLVCPAMFDLGESKRVVIISVTEGEDKPLKYPYMFHTSDVCIINKTDLLPYVDFDVEKAKEYALRVNHKLRFFELSATTGEGMTAWYEWIKENYKAHTK